MFERGKKLYQSLFETNDKINRLIHFYKNFTKERAKGFSGIPILSSIKGAEANCLNLMRKTELIIIDIAKRLSNEIKE